MESKRKKGAMNRDKEGETERESERERGESSRESVK
jgi:hypothetical protein